MAVAENAPDAVRVRDLKIELVRGGADIVDGIVLEVAAGEVLGLVGESGRGKTTVGMALLGYCRPGGRVTGGEVAIDGRDRAGPARRRAAAAARRHRLLHPSGSRYGAEPRLADRAAADRDPGGPRL